ncbi:MAG: hypothetical protein ED859_10640 [Desulfuromonadales bacterium]|nr:MAG: hypothetical protein ED859_10640 [Desulfuromonadales bacterium]
MRKPQSILFLLLLFVIVPTLSWSAALITDMDSTQPRGFTGPPVYNDQYQSLLPVIEGFYSPAFRYRAGNDGDWREWAGMTMANAARDPAFYPTVGVANKDFVNLLLAAVAVGIDTPNPNLYKLVGLNTAREVACALKIYDPVASPNACTPGQPITLLAADKLPVTADICLRCHSPVGWMEGRSEPPSPHFPYLKGQFWGAAFKEYPGHKAPYWSPTDAYLAGTPYKVDLKLDSEADMDGLQCDFCHRTKDNYKRFSRYDGKPMAAGSGGFFVNRYNIFGTGEVDAGDFEGNANFCGTCHDVTNPLIYTKTEVNGQAPNLMKHPIERTYTEWYWSGMRDKKCQDCHEPMKFPAAQTWLLYPGLDMLWGPVDKAYAQSPYNYGVPGYRTTQYKEALARNQSFMKTAASLSWPGYTKSTGNVQVKLQITNNTGHKLPTGFAEGRQMWVHLKVTDYAGKTVFEDGIINAEGKLVRTPKTRVYEQVVLAKGYENFKADGSYSIIDANKDGYVSHYEKEFHFVLMNYIEKDNRIPPKGYNKAAYQADGAFVIPYTADNTFGATDNDYPSGQNWDVLAYDIPLTGLGFTPKFPLNVTATLKYQTFNKEYIDFLDVQDEEKTVKYGGKARNIPDAGIYGSYQTWGDVLKAIWTASNKGQPVTMATSTYSIR